MIPDVVSALRLLLRNDADVVAILTDATRVYAGEMPAAEASAQSAAHGRPAVVISAAGGPGDRGYVKIARTRVDIRAYGGSPFEATRLSNEIHETLKALSRQRIAGGAPAITPTLIHSVMAESGPTPLRDADGDWPMTLRTYEVLAAEVAA